MRKTVLSALIAGLLLAMAGPASVQAQPAGSSGMQTVLTVSISGFDAIKGNVQAIAQASETPQLMMPLMMLGRQGPAGLDTTKPWGGVIQTDGQTFRGFGFVPVTDLKQALATLKPLATGSRGEPQPAADGTYELNWEGRQLVLAQKGGWAILADDRKTLTDVPADPSVLLGDLPKQYALAVRASAKNLPPAMRDQLVAQLQAGMSVGQQRLANESAEQYAIRTRTIQRSMQQFDKLIKQTDTILVGVAFDSPTKTLRLDAEVTALEGTPSAEEYALAAQAKSDLAGFYLPEAALTMLVASTLPESDAAQLQDMIDTYGSKAMDDLDAQDLSDAERKLAKQMLNDLIAVLRKTAESRRIDLGVSVLASADSLNIIGGVYVADIATLEKLFKQLVHLAIAEDPGVEKAIKLDAEEHQGVRLHTLSVPADALPSQEIPEMLVGDALTGAVGFSQQSAYFALGPQSIERLKQAIDQSKAAAGQTASPGRLSLSVTGIGLMVEGLGAAEESPMGPQIIAALKQGGQTDHVRISSEGIPNGMRSRLEVEPGVLKSIGAVVGVVMSQLLPPGGGIPPGGFNRQPGAF